MRSIRVAGARFANGRSANIYPAGAKIVAHAETAVAMQGLSS
jgi:hypothetical protein